MVIHCVHVLIKNPVDDLEQRKEEHHLSQPHLSPLFTSLVSEIIPSLVRVSAQGSMAQSPPPLSTSLTLVSQCRHPSSLEQEPGLDLTIHVEQCTRACLELTVGEFFEFAHNLVARGLDIEVFYLDVIPQAIRFLHDLWARDEITFLEVTQASWTMKRFVMLNSPEFVRPDVLTLAPSAQRFQAMVCIAPGSQHTLGALLVSQYLQRKGWHLLPNFDRTEKEIFQLVSTQWVDLLCVSASTNADLPWLKSMIKRVKSLSVNQDIQCLLGGPVVAWESGLQDELGVHAICHNVREAHTVGMKLVRVHRKVRKLNALTAAQLSLIQGHDSPPTQAFAQSMLSPPSTKTLNTPKSKATPKGLSRTRGTRPNPQMAG